MLGIAVINSDGEYRRRLLAAIEAENIGGYEVHMYSSTEKYLADGFVPDMVFTDGAKSADAADGNDDSATEYEKNGFVPEVLFFGDGKNRSGSIGKYIGIKEIFDIAEKRNSSLSKNTSGGHTSGMLVFTSPFGGVGTSSLASACAYFAAEKKKNVLYFSMDPFDSLKKADITGEKGLSDIFFGIKTGEKKEDAAMRITDAVRKGNRGVSELRGFADPRDENDITDTDMKVFSECMQLSGFEYSVVDYPFGIGEKDICFFGGASHIFIVATGDGLQLGCAFECVKLIRGIIGEQCPGISVIVNKCPKKKEFFEKTCDIFRVPLIEGVGSGMIAGELCRIGVPSEWI